MATDEVSYIIRAKDSFSDIHKKADSVVNNSAKIVAGASVAMAASIVGVTASLVAMSATTATAGDDLQKMSARLSISAETLSEMKHAAELSGASIGDIELGIKKMSKTALDADRGLVSATRSFDDLGVSVTDSNGVLKSSEQLFLDVTEGLNNVENETKRAALAQELLGRSGLNLLPLIKSGSEGLKEMRQEAQDLGITFSDFEANQSAAFVDASLRIKSSAIGIKNTLSKDLIPFFTLAMDSMADSFMDLKRSGDLDIWAAEVANGVIVSFGAIAEVGTNLPIIWQATMVSIKTVSADAVAILDTVLIGVEKFYDVLGALPGDIGTPYRQAADDISTMRESLSDIGADLLTSADASVKAGEEWAEWQLTAVAAIDTVIKKSKEATTAGAATSPGDAITEGEGEESSPIAVASADATKIIEINRNKLETLRIQEEEADLNEAELSALKFTRQVEAVENDRLLLEEKGLLTQELNVELREIEFLAEAEHERSITALFAEEQEQRLADEEGHSNDLFNLQDKSTSERLGIMGDFFNNLFIISGKSSRTLFEAAKAANISQALIDTYAGASKSLAAYPYPYNVIAAGLTIASGLANVATISSTSFGSSSTDSSSTSTTSISTDSVSDTSDSLVGTSDDPVVAAQDISIIIKGEVITAETIEKLIEPIVDGINRGGLERDIKISAEALAN